MVWDDFIGTTFKISQWAWPRPLLGENPYLGICITDFNQIRYIIFFSYFYIIVRKWAKSDCIHAYFPYNSILNSIWCFHFPVCKSSNNDYIGVKLCVNNTFKVCHFMTKNCLNRISLSNCTEYVDPSANSWLFTENIGQHRTRRQDPQRNLKRVYHLTLWEYKMFGYIRT